MEEDIVDTMIKSDSLPWRMNVERKIHEWRGVLSNRNTLNETNHMEKDKIK